MARALAADPPVLLMDEPFGAVDPVVRERLQDEFLRLQRELGKTVVFVTHDIDEAVRIGDRIAVFAAGGRLAQFDTPAELLGAPGRRLRGRLRGLDRGLRRLAVTPIDRGAPRAARRRHAPATSARAIDVDSTLEEALAVLLRDDKRDGRRQAGRAVRRRAHPQRRPPGALRRSVA